METCRHTTRRKCALSICIVSQWAGPILCLRAVGMQVVAQFLPFPDKISFCLLGIMACIKLLGRSSKQQSPNSYSKSGTGQSRSVSQFAQTAAQQEAQKESRLNHFLILSVIQSSLLAGLSAVGLDAWMPGAWHVECYPTKWASNGRYHTGNSRS